MGEIPAAGTEPTTPSNARSGRRFGRLDAVLDVVGLLFLAWMLLLWQLGFPGFTDTVRAEMSLALDACAALLAIVVLVRLGRPSGPARPVAAAPLLILLVGVAGWRFVVGFVQVVGQRQTSGAAVHVGLWDGYVVALGLAAVVLLVVRADRPSRLRRAIVTVAVSAAVTANLVVAGINYSWLFNADIPMMAASGAAVLLPPLIVALVGAAMAPGWLQRMHKGQLSAAAAVLTWGLVVAGEDVIPQYLLIALRYGRGFIAMLGEPGPVAGLDWLQGALVVAAAALISPVVRAYRDQDRDGRLEILRGPLAVLAILLFARVVGELTQYRFYTSKSFVGPGQISVELDRSDLLIPMLGLLGAALVLLVALRPQRGSAPWTMLVAVVLIAVPSLWYLTPAFQDPSPPQSPFDFGLVILPFTRWDGAMFMQTFVLPLMLLVLLVAGRRGAPDPSDSPGPEPITSQDALATPAGEPA